MVRRCDRACSPCFGPDRSTGDPSLPCPVSFPDRLAPPCRAPADPPDPTGGSGSGASSGPLAASEPGDQAAVSASDVGRGGLKAGFFDKKPNSSKEQASSRNVNTSSVHSVLSWCLPPELDVDGRLSTASEEEGMRTLMISILKASNVDGSEMEHVPDQRVEQMHRAFHDYINRIRARTSNRDPSDDDPPSLAGSSDDELPSLQATSEEGDWVTTDGDDSNAAGDSDSDASLPELESELELEAESSDEEEAPPPKKEAPPPKKEAPQPQPTGLPAIDDAVQAIRDVCERSGRLGCLAFEVVVRTTLRHLGPA